MRFLIDAQLPGALCTVFADHGHDAMHTLDLPESNATKDRVINQLSISDQRVVVSKDMDFFYSHMASGRPWKLLLVKTGNIATGDLCELFTRNMRAIESALENYTLIELDRVNVTPVL